MLTKTEPAPGAPPSPAAAEAGAAPPAASTWRTAGRAVGALAWRELLKFVRERSRLVGAVVQPIGFWLLMGLGFERTFRMPDAALAGVGYLEYLFPGIVVMTILFTAVFSTITIVEDRKKGFLQAALVAPVARPVLVLGGALGGTLLAAAEALLFLLAAPLVGLTLTAGGLAVALAHSLLLGLAFTALGFAIAWQMASTRGFHSVMIVFLLPLWFLSGAPFPSAGAAPVFQWVIALNPVSYAVSGIRQALYVSGAAPDVLAAPLPCLLVTAAFAAAMTALAVYAVRRPLYARD